MREIALSCAAPSHRKRVGMVALVPARREPAPCAEAPTHFRRECSPRRRTAPGPISTSPLAGIAGDADRKCMEPIRAERRGTRSRGRSSEWRRPAREAEDRAGHSDAPSVRRAGGRRPWVAQEAQQVGGVGRFPTSCRKAGPKLAQYDEGKSNGTCRADDFDPLEIAAHEIAICVGVEGDIHFHTASSTRSKSATARSKSGSSCQEPIRSSRSVCRKGLASSSRPRARASTTTALRLLASRLARCRRGDQSAREPHGSCIACSRCRQRSRRIQAWQATEPPRDSRGGSPRLGAAFVALRVREWPGCASCP